jgi:hypothetical protein
VVGWIFWETTWILWCWNGPPTRLWCKPSFPQMSPHGLTACPNSNHRLGKAKRPKLQKPRLDVARNPSIFPTSNFWTRVWRDVVFPLVFLPIYIDTIYIYICTYTYIYVYRIPSDMYIYIYIYLFIYEFLNYIYIYVHILHIYIVCIPALCIYNITVTIP